MPSQELEETIEAALIRLTSNFSSFADENAYLVQLKEWNTAMDVHPWVTPDLADAALEHILYQEPGRDKVPPVAHFLDICRTLKREADAKAKGAELLPELTTAEIIHGGPLVIREQVRESFRRGRALQALHRSLVQHAHGSGHTAPPPHLGLSDAGAAWVAAEYGRARTYVGQNGSLQGYTPAEPPKPVETDPLSGKTVGDIAPDWTPAQERELITRWPHLKHRASLDAA